MSWNSLTERQKELDKAIERSGITLDGSDACLQRVMDTIGATPAEREYVRSRIGVRLRAAAILNETDDFIRNTERMLEEFERDDEEWRRRGRALGFDF